MLTAFTVIHVIVCFLMIALVLLQDPKSGGAGGMFGGGGGSNSLLGATGAATFLTRLTRGAAIMFGVTCIALSLFAKPNVGSVLDSVPAQAAPVGVAAPAEGAPVPQNATGNPAMQDPAQAGTEAAPAQGSNPQRVKGQEPSTAPAANK